MTDGQYQCPLCDYQGGEKGSVKAHITRKTDSVHKGKSGPNYTDEIELVPVDGNTGSNSDGQTVADGGPDSSSDGEPEAGSNVSTGTDTTSSSGGIVPDSDQYEGPQDSSDPVDDEPECPACGSTNHADSTAYLRQYQDRLEAEHINTLRNGEFVCGSCGGVW